MDISDVLFALFLLVAAIQLFFYLVVFSRLAFHKDKSLQKEMEPVSIIICARNEADNLLENLPHVLAQEYENFEVIVANDCSYDNTEEVLKSFEEKHSNFKTVTIKESEVFSGGKKFALTLGIKAARHQLLVLTDADCKPVSNQWLKNVAGSFSEQSQIVLGYGAYQKTKGLLNKLIRYDAFYIALQYLSFAKALKPYMGVGRNLAYRKQLFFDHKGFASHRHIASGDDDLFINKAAFRPNTVIVAEHDSHTVSKVKRTFSAWFGQKRRHITTASKYKFTDKFLLGLLSLSQVSFMALFIALILMKYNIHLIVGLFVLRFLIQMFIFIKSMKLLKEMDLLIFAPLFEIALILLYPIFALSNLFCQENTWKN